MADGFVRAGIGGIIIIDGDVVEPHNLSRSVYHRADIGQAKATCLTNHLRAINDGVSVRSLTCRLQEVGKKRLAAFLTDADLIVAATDVPAAQALLNRISQVHKKSAPFVGLYRGAKGGEIGLSFPGLTPCMECYAGSKRFDGMDTVERPKDYGSGRRQGEAGLGADITYVTSAAVRVGLSLLCTLSGEKSATRDFVLAMLRQGYGVVTLGMEPDYSFFPDVFAETAGQYAFQSVWLSLEKQDDCPACGQNRINEDPLKTMTGPIDRNQF